MTKFIQRLDLLIHQRKITRNRLLQDLHLGKNSFLNWETRKSIPNGKTLIRLSSYFDVSVDYLLGMVNDKLSEDEYTLIKLYQSLSSEEQKILLKTAAALGKDGGKNEL